MAKVRQRTWTVPGQRTKRRAWGFVTTENGAQVRRFKAEWTKEQAEAALAECLLKIEPQKPKVGGITLGQATDRYLGTRTNRGNPRSKDEKRVVEHLKTAFGADTPLAEITAARISEYKTKRLTAVRKIGEGESQTERPLTAAAVNRPLAILRHLLQLATEEWEVLERVPRIKLEKEPEGRVVWLEPDEEHRLLDACRASRTKHLADLVTVALESGLRRGELFGLTWDRIDLSRGLLRLEKTKSGKRRDVHMRQAVYNVLAARRAHVVASLKPDAEGRIPEPSGRVWPVGDVRTAFENAVTAAKMDAMDRFEGERFTMHGCRHHFASWFMMRGGNLLALSKILGHAKVGMTEKYAHLAPDHLRSEMSKTERGTQPTEKITQEITHEPAAREVVPSL
jgi:integrase